MARRFARALVALAALLAPQMAGAQDRLVVASKMDTEGALIAHMIAQTLETAGLRVELRARLGATAALRAAILKGEIDLYPDYTGNGALFFGREADPAWRDAAEGRKLASELDAGNGLAWLAPAPANNAWGVAVHRDVADGARVRTWEDFARYLAGGGRVKLAASREFVESRAALPAFEAGYGVKLGQNQIVVVPSGDTATTMLMAWEGRDGVNAAMVYGTDGRLSTVNLAVLEDSKAVQAVYAPVVVARVAILDRHPAIRARIEALFAGLDTPTLQKLNAAVAVDGDDVAKVARGHLVAKGLLGPPR